MGAEEAARRVDEGAILLDVREPDEWEAGHSPDAVHVPLAALAASIDRLDKDQPIVTVCRVGGRSERAAAALLQRGYDAVNLAGGMQAWQAAGMPVVTESGEPGQVI
ncbi:MAG: rhodanese-like domain-containing protein [Acidimicrobiia bacterium]|nr:rhodanese-like domain-containing protein [Acidimicrobiia bacterium]